MADKTNECRERKCMEEGIALLERNNFFCGKLMVERDFWAEQRYNVGKHRLHNIHLHGWGAVSGLAVAPHPYCPNLKLVINPGLAIDSAGREIWVPQMTEVDLESYKKNGGGNAAKPPKLYLCLHYRECETEAVPVFLDDCGCGSLCQPNRIRETFGLALLPLEAIGQEKLDVYLYDRAESDGKVNVSDSTKLRDLPWKGEIWIKTPSGIYKGDSSSFAASATIADLSAKIASSPAKVEMKIVEEKIVIKSTIKGDRLILEENGENPFFAAVKIPAFNTDKGYKMLVPYSAAPGKNPLILAEISGYDNVTAKHLDPAEPEFKTAAYSIDNLTYRKTLPGVELVNKLAGYCMIKIDS